MWKRRKVPDPPVSPEGQASRDTTTVSFSEHRRRCGTVGSTTTRETRPPFRPSGFPRTVSPPNPSWEAFSLVSRVSRGSVSHGSIPGSPSNSHRDIPSLSITPQVRRLNLPSAPFSARVSPISPKIPRHGSPPFPIHGVFPLFAVRPLRGGGIMANFRSHVFSCGRDFFNGPAAFPRIPT